MTRVSAFTSVRRGHRRAWDQDGRTPPPRRVGGAGTALASPAMRPRRRSGAVGPVPAFGFGTASLRGEIAAGYRMNRAVVIRAAAGHPRSSRSTPRTTGRSPSSSVRRRYGSRTSPRHRRRHHRRRRRALCAGQAATRCWPSPSSTCRRTPGSWSPPPTTLRVTTATRSTWACARSPPWTRRRPPTVPAPRSCRRRTRSSPNGSRTSSPSPPSPARNPAGSRWGPRSWPPSGLGRPDGCVADPRGALRIVDRPARVGARRWRAGDRRLRGRPARRVPARPGRTSHRRVPQPEEAGALDESIADDVQADHLANDPDADRMSAAVPAPDGSGWHQLSGDGGAAAGQAVAQALTTGEPPPRPWPGIRPRLVRAGAGSKADASSGGTRPQAPPRPRRVGVRQLIVSSGRWCAGRAARGRARPPHGLQWISRAGHRLRLRGGAGLRRTGERRDGTGPPRCCSRRVAPAGSRPHSAGRAGAHRAVDGVFHTTAHVPAGGHLTIARAMATPSAPAAGWAFAGHPRRGHGGGCGDWRPPTGSSS